MSEYLTSKCARHRDRKRKKFVGQTGRESNVKKLKTENGRKIAASYKSQSYKRWRERHKIDAILPGEEEEESSNTVSGIVVIVTFLSVGCWNSSEWWWCVCVLCVVCVCCRAEWKIEGEKEGERTKAHRSERESRGRGRRRWGREK